MRRQTIWRGLTAFSLLTAGVMAVLALVALSLAEAPAAGAAGVCAAAFFVPGLFFLNYTRRLRLRDAALAHAAQIAELKGVTEAATMAKELHVPTKDAELILRKAIAEGILQGEVDNEGRFVSANVSRCPSCGAPLSRDANPSRCPRCGTALSGG